MPHHYEFKLKYMGEEQDKWEDLPVAFTVFVSTAFMKRTAALIAGAPEIYEVRVNLQGSNQGNYFRDKVHTWRAQ